MHRQWAGWWHAPYGGGTTLRPVSNSPATAVVMPVGPNDEALDSVRSVLRYVGGLEQASHMGGFGLEYGFGSTSRLGMRKYLPS